MIEPLRRQWMRVAERVDALSVRERVLVFAAVLAAVFFAAHNLLLGPLQAEQRRLERAVKEKRTQTEALEAQLRTLLEDAARDPDAAGLARLESLRARIQEMDAQLGKMVTGFVTPREMAKLVEQALSKNRGLEVVKVENLPPTSVLESAKGEVQAEHMVYKHGVRIEMKGGYRDIVNYLRALESLPWKVFWGEAALAAEEYPVSRVSVVIFTLSRHRGWIGT